MTEADAFIQAIIETPWDDSPRLVFADWLEEHGKGERSEFIRVQCEFAAALPDAISRGCASAEGVKRHAGPCCGRLNALRRRERELLFLRCHEGKHLLRHHWLYAHGWPRLVEATGDWRRGFVERVSVTAQYWLKYGAAVLAAQPVVKVQLVGRHFLLQRKQRETVEMFRDVSLRVAEAWIAAQLHYPLRHPGGIIFE